MEISEILNKILTYIVIIAAFFSGAMIFHAGTKVSFLKENGYLPPEKNNTAEDKEKKEPAKGWAEDL